MEDEDSWSGPCQCNGRDVVTRNGTVRESEVIKFQKSIDRKVNRT
jgi:hypothetical protein